jgi:hypothetical protein
MQVGGVKYEDDEARASTDGLRHPGPRRDPASKRGFSDVLAGPACIGIRSACSGANREIDRQAVTAPLRSVLVISFLQ